MLTQIRSQTLHIVLVLCLVLLATYVPVVLNIMLIGRCLHPVSALISHRNYSFGGITIIQSRESCFLSSSHMRFTSLDLDDGMPDFSNK